MRSPICHLVDISEIPGTSIPTGRATNDGIHEYEINDNNVVKGSHVADYRTATLQIPREIAAIARSPSGTSATELISTINDLLCHSPAKDSKVLIHHLQIY